MSWVGERVYKLKKPVRFPYPDFSSLERRAAACCAEVSLNRRLAPDIYLGEAPLMAGQSGYSIGGRGRTIDWLIVMRRLDERQTVEAALIDRKATQAQVDHRLLASRGHLSAWRPIAAPMSETGSWS